MIERYSAVLICLMVLFGPISSSNASDEYPQQDRKKYALLVGCTEYQNESVWDLRGSANDVALWHRLLTNQAGFAFPKENVTRLSGWSDDVGTRPTYSNIVAAFEDLVAKAGPDVQFFIQLSGHGISIPIPDSQEDPLDPKNPEPDGMDEVFLPADVKNWSRAGGKQLENAILDDQIGAWLDKMREQGASVWMVYDCCHSGTMTRGMLQHDDERPRSIDPASLGVPQNAIASAAQRARDAVAKVGRSGESTRGLLADNSDSLGIMSGHRPRGSLVAFYACMSYEEEVDLARPKGAELSPENFYGLLSYTLVNIIEQRKSRLTYRELSNILRARYRAERFTRPPNPYAVGDLDLEVLGVTAWPKRPDILLTREEATLTINAGELRGVTPRSVLTVLPPAGDARNEKTVLGYLRVINATPLQANVVVCDETGTPGGDSAKFEDLCRCTILTQDLGDMLVKLALMPEDILRPVYDKLSPSVRAMVQIVPADQSEWVLCQVTPGEASKALEQAGLKGDRVLLVQNEVGGFVETTTKKTTIRINSVGNANRRKIYGGYAVNAIDPLLAHLERDLQKVFKAQNLWRVAGGLGSNSNVSPSRGLAFDVLLMKDERDLKGKPQQMPQVDAGQIIGFQITNNGSYSLWYTVLYCDADLMITVYAEGPIQAKQTVRLPRARVTPGTSGMEGMIAMAVPIAASKENRNFRFLEQEALGQAEDGTKARSADSVPQTPFGRLMAGAAFNTGVRSAEANEPTTPAIRSRYWIVDSATNPTSN